MTGTVRSAPPRSEPPQDSPSRRRERWSALLDIILDSAAAAIIARGSVSTRNSVFRPEGALGPRRPSVASHWARVHSWRAALVPRAGVAGRPARAARGPTQPDSTQNRRTEW